MLKSKRLEKRVSMPKVVNFFDLIHLNERLAQQGLLSKIHLRDTCGKLEKTKEQIEAFFAIKGMTVEFDLTGGKNFWIV